MDDFDFTPAADDTPDALGDAHSPIPGHEHGYAYESWTQTEVTHFESITSYETVYHGGISDSGEQLDTYTVQPGDSLWLIAESHLGDGNLWPEIHALNPWIDDPNLIYPGQELVLPDSHDHSVDQHEGNLVTPETYTVQPGDSLWLIAESHLGDGNLWPEIHALNPWIDDPNLIYPGQELVLPDSHDHGGYPDDGTVHPNGDTLGTYTVQPGDSLWQIAENHLGDGSRWTEIAALNPDVAEHPDLIYPGDELVMPEPGDHHGHHGDHGDVHNVYTVQSGDSMWQIAENLLGDGNRWTEIAALNPQIADPNLIHPGDELVMPAYG